MYILKFGNNPAKRVFHVALLEKKRKLQKLDSKTFIKQKERAIHQLNPIKNQL